jgi:hypothetical protein
MSYLTRVLPVHQASALAQIRPMPQNSGSLSKLDQFLLDWWPKHTRFAMVYDSFLSMFSVEEYHMLIHAWEQALDKEALQEQQRRLRVPGKEREALEARLYHALFYAFYLRSKQVAEEQGLSEYRYLGAHNPHLFTYNPVVMLDYATLSNRPHVAQATQAFFEQKWGFEYDQTIHPDSMWDVRRMRRIPDTDLVIAVIGDDRGNDYSYYIVGCWWPRQTATDDPPMLYAV